MKSIIAITLFVALSLTTLHAQWHEVNSPTSNSITDIHFADSVNGFMSCGMRTVLKTTNGGLDWQAFDTGISASFMSVFGIDKDTVYTARVSLYKSTDSCDSWVDVGGLGSWGSTIFDIHFTSPKTGFIIKSGKLYKTNDYGLNWYKVYDKVYSGGNILFTSQDTGYVVGGGIDDCDPGPCNFPFNHGAIIKTTDGGESWQKLSFFNDTLNIISASFIDNNFGYCFSSNNTIQKTEDGGLTWLSMNTGIALTITGGLFINKDIGFIITLYGQIYITKNGGMNWDLEYTASHGGFFEIGSSDKMVVAAGGSLICVRKLDDLTINNQGEYFTSKEVLIYPNPAKTCLTVSNPGNIKIERIDLFDILGRKVMTWKNLDLTNNKLNIENVLPGMYLIKTKTKTGIKAEKLIVQ